MCLRIKVEHPELVLAKGTHLGYEWLVVNNGLGFRCGYVRLPKGHPWYGVSYDDIEVDVHGGITFGDYDVQCEGDGPDDAYWIGFDCMHDCDAQDPKLPTKHPFHSYGTFVRTQEYVENECRKLCEQAHKANEENSSTTTSLN